ncbi:type I restriction endonuclease [Polyangium sp. y55x31]|uniref:type I restriction endonuclease n=1 Tax=Polyangium sp. y55x31 TaxID=3042688 RepID=UPI0024823FD9|nr:type I restriction endonuclease [Polyangium sp. y55x31]MDI1483611.1 type I restriction endonuclease [Polyangium sp. y55x31]
MSRIPREHHLELSGLQGTSLLEASQTLQGRLTDGISLTTFDAKGQQRDRDVFFFDFEKPTNNEFLVTRQLPVRGAKNKIIPDIVLSS